MDERLLTIWLSLACTPGSKTFPSLLKKFKTVQRIYDANDKEINSAIDPKSADRAALVDKNLEKAQNVFDFCRKMSVGITTYFDDDYPDALRRIDNPPVLLYYRGTLPDFKKQVKIAIVGTRNLSSYGRKCTYEISYDLAKSGALIVSGMALGIDGMAHTGALAAEMPTVAVLGSGINVCYPSAHLTLAREIVKHGCVMTEFPPDTKPLPHNFPCRNRIVSGLSDGLLLIEGMEKSGALITARLAKEQGRKVYAVPGNVGSKWSAAPTLALKSGANVATAAEDIIKDFEKQGSALLNRFKLSNARPDMNERMKAYAVSALTPDDDVFKPSRVRITKSEDLKKSEQKNENKAPDIAQNSDTNDSAGSGFSFDKKTLTVYKRIPEGAECSYESLAGDGITVSDVSTAVLRLQIGGFVTVYPGDFVARKFKG